MSGRLKGTLKGSLLIATNHHYVCHIQILLESNICITTNYIMSFFSSMFLVLGFKNSDPDDYQRVVCCK